MTLAVCPDARAYVSDGLVVLVSRDGGLLHISASLRDRKPTDDEMARVRRAFAPAVLMDEESGLGVNAHVRHLWEVTQ
jgi:hypothetical protein